MHLVHLAHPQVVSVMGRHLGGWAHSRHIAACWLQHVACRSRHTCVHVEMTCNMDLPIVEAEVPLLPHCVCRCVPRVWVAVTRA